MLLTIFTPTYNRRRLLTIAYQHLCSQTNTDFLWLIVDDGSEDYTSELVGEWIKEKKIKITYVYQRNEGKMRAHNRAVMMTDTELFLCMDSDDYLADNAVEVILRTWNCLKEEGKEKFLAGIVAYKGKDLTHTMNHEVFPDIERTTLTHLYENGFCGETALIYRTRILKTHLFPVFDGETFIPEFVVYNRIDFIYPLYILPRIVMICKYQPDGLTNSIAELREKNPKGWLLYYKLRIISTPPSTLRYKYIAHAICFTWKIKGDIYREIRAPRKEISLAIPGAILLRLAGKL